MNLARIDDLEGIELEDGFVWRPVRRHFGIQAFGTNAYTPGASGRIVEEHTEQTLGHEEIYLVLRGRVRFTVDGNDHELGPSQLVFVRDPSLPRGAVALTDDAAVLAIGGSPGRLMKSPRGSTCSSQCRTCARAGTTTQGGISQEGLEARPGSGALLYNLACTEALAGESDKALDLLNEAIAVDERFRGYAQTDEDFASIREDPRFPR